MSGKRILHFIILAAAVIVMLGILSGTLPAQDISTYSGEQLLKERCSKCHDLKRVEKEYGEYDRGQWEKIVDRMIKRGAQLNAGERAAVIEHLAVQQAIK